MTREFLAWLSILAGLFLALVCWLIAYPTYAQENQPTVPACAPLSQIVGFLESEYNEKLRWFGDVQTGARLAILDSKDGTWTVIQTDGITACVMSSGTGSTFRLGEPA